MKLTFLLASLLTVLVIFQAKAADRIDSYSIDKLLESSKAKEALNDDVKLFFGKQSFGNTQETYGEVMTNKKTNAFMKSDKEACEWVMLSALKALQARALKEGMNAVVGIESYYKKREFISETQFECGAGAILVGVTLKGTLVKL